MLINISVFKKVIFIIAIVLICLAILSLILFVPVSGKANENDYWKMTDEFDLSALDTIEVEGEDFKILQLTDLHYYMPHMTNETDNVVKTLVKENNPDMIVITGDSVFGPTNLIYTEHVVELMDSFGIPWAIVYGNHDDEGKADKFWMGEKYENAKNCLYHNGPYNIGGTGNYVVNLTKDGEPFYSLFMMDSNTYMTYEGKREYACFEMGQIAWYEWMTTNLINNGFDKSMMFFHIPLVQYATAYDEWEESGFDENIGFGEKREDVCCAPVDTGMFDMIKKLGSTTHTFAGHDHVNNFSVEYQGVVLSYGLKSSKQFYNDKDLLGGTIITIKGDKSVDIEHKYVKA